MEAGADDVRSLARAAAALAALAQPDVAAVVAALPRRPGSTAPLAELAELSGRDLRVLGKAVTRGRDAGVLQVDGDRVGLDTEGAGASVAALVAMTPLGRATHGRPELEALAPFGLVHGVPSGHHAADLLTVLRDELPETEMTEREVTDRLALLGDDPAGLRRALVDAQLLWRTPDGARYRRV